VDQWQDLALKLMEEERRRLARDIHDGPAQVLSMLTMRFDVIKKMVERNPQMALVEISRIQDTLRSSINDLRRMIYDLKPLAFEEHGWKSVLMTHVERFQELHRIPVTLYFEEGLPRFPEQMEMGLYRLIQECTNNIAKHAGATRVEIKVHSENQSRLLIEVSDNGKGFDPAATKSGAFGLQGMKERAALIGGHVDVHSVIGEGTRIVITIPFPERGSPQ
jgi:two-component system sensor histidine kinase DegS